MTVETSSGDLADLGSGDTQIDHATRALDLVEVTDSAIWADLLARTARPQLTQSWAYGEGKRTGGWQPRRMVFEERGQPVAIVQALELRIAGFRLGTRINRGPLLIDPAPETAERVLATLRRAFGRWYGGPLSIAPGLDKSERTDALLERLGYRRRTPQTWWSARIDLTQDVAALRAGFASTFRNRLKKAEAGGLTVRVASHRETVEWMIARHTENMQAKRFNAVGERFLRAFHAHASDDLVIFQAIQDGTPVAGMSVVRFADVAEYHTGWFGPAARDANAGNFLMWAIMAEMKARGCAAFDVGGLYEGHGYTQFKRGMRGTEYVIGGEWISF